MNDLKFVFRQLLKERGFTAVVVITLALGIGANTAVFHFVNAALLRPLPYRNASQLVRIASVNPTLGVADSRSSDLNILDWRERSTAFDELAAFQEWDGILTMAGRSESVRVNWITPNLLTMLGVRPLQGRLLVESDADRSVLLPDGVWERWGRDPELLGRTIKLDGETATVVGILPPEVAAPAQGARARDQVFIAADLRRTPWPRGLQLRNVVGHLKPGVTVVQAQEDLSRVALTLQQEFPETNRGWGVQVTDLKTWQTNQVRNQLWTVYGATAVILLMACLNASNILLIRGEARRKELAIRVALGSTRWRIIRQLLGESVILSCLGAGVGLLLAWWSQRTLLAMAPASLGMEAAGFEWPVFISALLATSVAALLSGLLPALRFSRVELSRTIAESSLSTSPVKNRHRLLNGLVVGQMAVSMALLFAAGLALLSFRALLRVEPGFSKQNAICFRLGTFSKTNLAERLMQQLSELPGVQSVGGANIDLLNDVFSNGIRITVDDREAPGGSLSGTVDLWHATTNYFSAAGIPLRAGRVFETQDRYDVVIVNDALARRFFPKGDAVGRTLRVPWTNSIGLPKRIIGLVGSVKQRGLREPDVPIYYMHYQGQDLSHLSLTVRTVANPAALLPAIRETIRQNDPELAMTHVTTTEELVARAMSGERFATVLMTAFALLALILAAVGLYGVMSYSVSQRTREIGVRLALGAQYRDIFQSIVGRGLRLAGLGILVGGAGAVVLARTLPNFFFDVSLMSPASLVGMATLLGAVAFVACYLPARRATKVEPMAALRHE